MERRFAGISASLIAWSASNRFALVRIPASREQSTRMELRSPDSTCNPYLALAVCLAAGLDGIKNEIANYTHSHNADDEIPCTFPKNSRFVQSNKILEISVV